MTGARRAAAPAWLDELQPVAGPPWHAIGTRAVPGAWLARSRPRPPIISLKRALLADHYDQVVASLPDTDAVSAEAARFVAAAAGQRLSGESPVLEAAALMVEEDLCVLTRRDEHWTLAAGVVCFPSLWRLDEKLGRSVAEIHGPVPAYDTELATRVDRLLDRLRPDRPLWRRNWFIHACADLFQPTSPAPAASPPVPGGLWLRSERQTLLRLQGSILFTIHTEQVPLAVVAGRAELAAALAASVRSWSPALVAYRAAGTWRDAVVAWLDAAAD